MKHFLRQFFNDNSVCVGLCDMKRKNEKQLEFIQQNLAFAKQTYENYLKAMYETSAPSFQQTTFKQNDFTPVYDIQEFSQNNIFKKPQFEHQQNNNPIELNKKTVESKQNSPKPVELKPVQQKPQKQSLAQRFAAQQKEYAAQQAFLAEERKRFEAQQIAAQKSFEQQAKVTQEMKTLKESQQKAQFIDELTRKQNNNTICTAQREFVIDGKSYVEYGPSKVQEPKTIVNGNMKKVVSPAVPVRHI